MKNRKSKFFTFLLSLVPGLGHYYLGLMKRGLQFMAGFFLAVGMVAFFGNSFGPGRALIPVFAIVIPILWFYCIFDALHAASRIQQGEDVPDQNVYPDDWLESQKPKSKFWTFALSILPGLGHVYLGLMKRGSQYMALFLVAVVFLNTLRIDLLFVALPIIWFVALFDALECASRTDNEGQTDDQPLFTQIDWKRKQNWIGAGLLFLGIYLLIDRIFLPYLPSLLAQFIPHEWVTRHLKLYVLQGHFQTIIVSIVLMGIGLKLWLGKKTSRKEGERQ